jgi:xanthine/uracil/vitamin C permease (AzgA family)
MIMMPLSFSISDGIAFGFISFVSLKLATRQWRQIPWPPCFLARRATCFRGSQTSSRWLVGRVQRQHVI